MDSVHGNADVLCSLWVRDALKGSTAESCGALYILLGCLWRDREGEVDKSLLSGTRPPMHSTLSAFISTLWGLVRLDERRREFRENARFLRSSITDPTSDLPK